MATATGTKKKTYKKGRSYKKKDYGPSRADIMAAEIEEEILKFWREMMESSPQGVQRPWVLNVTRAERAGAYLKDGSRIPYQGSFNQWLIAYATKDYTSELAPLVISQGQLCEALGVKKFYETEACQAGVRSNMALYRPNIRQQYVLSNGMPWEAPDGARRRPTQQEIDQYGLRSREVCTGFGTSAAYSMADLYPYLPADLKIKIDMLAEARRGKGREINPEDSFETFIEGYVQDMIDRQGIKHEFSNNRAFYSPGDDAITLPHSVQFVNPLEYLSTVAHELAHSTMHLNGRLPIVKGDPIGYAIEEVIAETTAAMVVKSMENDLPEEFRNRDDVKKMFEDYYTNSHNYVRDYGSKTEFLKMVDRLEDIHRQEAEDKTKNTLRSVMTQITAAVTTLEKKIEPSTRLEKKEANIEALKRKIRERRNDPGLSN